MAGHNFATYVEDLEQDPFDALDFVERLAWRMTGGSEEISDPVALRNKFEQEIGSLQLLCDQFQSKITTLERKLNDDKKDYVNQMQKLYDKNTDAVEKIKQLDLTMQTVSTKVVHLGDQLESVHQPRQRAHDALQLIIHFDEFLADQPLNSIIFTDPDKLLESADLVQKLYSISQELSKEKFAAVQARIAHRYEEVERLLIDEFGRAQRDEKRMAEVARILSEFKENANHHLPTIRRTLDKSGIVTDITELMIIREHTLVGQEGYGHCVDRWAEWAVQSWHGRGDDVWDECLQLCLHQKPRIHAIFPAPMPVIQKLVLNLFTGKLKDHISAKLRDCKDGGDSEGYLVALAHSYNNTTRLCKMLEDVHITTDASYLPMLTRAIFDRYLVTYCKDELDYLHQQCSSILRRFYESKKHQKKQIQTGSLQELKRDVTARLLTVETYGGETFLSEDVAISILQETKNAFNRAIQLCENEDVAKHGEAIFDLLLKYLYNEHLEYAVELAIAGITLGEPKSEPPAYFFSVVSQNTTIVLLLLKQFEDSVSPLVKGSNVEAAVSKKLSSSLRSLEQRISLGMERQLNAIIGYVRFILNSEQKKTDFRNETQTFTINEGGSKACQQVVRFLNIQMTAVGRGCDGGNLQTIQNELASRLYKLLLNHIQQMTYNSDGAVLLLCDLAEYRKCVGGWRMNGALPAARLFEQLHALANLLVVLPDNLADAATSSMLADVDRGLVQDFLKLRHDYRALRLNRSVY